MKHIAVLLFFSGTLAGADNAAPRQIDYGFEQRVRNENWNNLFDYNETLDDQRVQVRYRTRVWLKAPLTSDIDVNIGLNQETNQIFVTRSPWRFDELIFETANIDFKKLFVKGLSLKVGRQNIMKNEGFLILEGSPGDGSRTIYQNAAVLGYTWKKSKIEAIGILNPRQDRMLPVWHDRKKDLLNWNQSSLGLYYTDNNAKRTAFESYYFYTKETGDRRAPTNYQFRPDRHVHTAGGRVVQKFDRGLSVTGEFAGQWGAYHGGGIVRGWGGYGYVKRTFGAKSQHYLQTGYWGMSGDNPSTPNKDEGWDPLYARWPKWSELYIYTQFREYAPSFWSNTALWQMEWGYAPIKPIGLRLTYYKVDAYHPFPKGDSRIFGSGTVRGHMPQIRADFAINKQVSGHVLYEHMAAGNFYSYRSHAYFLRFEMIYRYQGSKKLAH